MSALRQWMQSNQVFDKDLLLLFPKYGVNDPEKDLYKVSEEKWNELTTFILTEKRAELKDNAANLRFKKKINKITKIWKEQRKKHNVGKNKNNYDKTKKKQKKQSIKAKEKRKLSIIDNNNENEEKKKDELEELRMENRKIRRELSSKNSDFNRLQQDFNTFKKQKEDEIKKLNNKYNTKNEEYSKLLKQYKQINQRINSKYHDNSAKDKEISSLKTDKTTLLNDINELMKKEQEKYDKLLYKYNELKTMNNRNLKYKLRYKKEKSRQKKRHKKRGNNYTVDLNNADIEKITEIDDDDNKDDDNKLNIFPSEISENDTDGISNELIEFEYYRPKKYKPSKEKRARARAKTGSMFVASRSKPKKKNPDI